MAETKKPKRKPPTGPTRAVLRGLQRTFRTQMDGARKAGNTVRALAFEFCHGEVLAEIRKMDLKPKRGKQKPSRAK